MPRRAVGVLFDNDQVTGNAHADHPARRAGGVGAEREDGHRDGRTAARMVVSVDEIDTLVTDLVELATALEYQR